MRKDLYERKTEILKWIDEEKPKNFICKELKCQEGTLNNWLNKNHIKYKGRNNWKKGKKIIVIPIENYLKKGTTIGSNKLKNKLFESGLKEKICENPKCKRTKWNGLEIPLQLHHIDGDRHNNELNNLQILCANCHSQTDNFAGKSLRKEKTKPNKRKKIIKHCSCGKELSVRAKKCKSCEKLGQQRKIHNRPSLNVILRELENKSYKEVGRKYNVSDNCIRKWIKSYGGTPPKMAP